MGVFWVVGIGKCLILHGRVGLSGLSRPISDDTR